MPTPSGVNYLLQFLMICLIPQLSKARIKSGRSVLCPIVFYLSIGVQYYVKLGAKIQNKFRFYIIILPKNDFEGIGKENLMLYIAKSLEISTIICTFADTTQKVTLSTGELSIRIFFSIPISNCACSFVIAIIVLSF